MSSRLFVPKRNSSSSSVAQLALKSNVVSSTDGNSRRVAIVGDGACGKTSLLSRFALGYFPQNSLPTVFDSYVTEVCVDGRSVQLALWDTADREDCERFRNLAYSKSHAILIGFNVTDPEGLANVRQKWTAEAREKRPNLPIILVGLKKDLRVDRLAEEETKVKSLVFVSAGQGSELAEQCGVSQYLECSALTGDGVDDVFEAATRAAMSVVNTKCGRSGQCVIL